MSFTEKNILITLVNFSVLLSYFMNRVRHMLGHDTFTESNVFGLWGTIIFGAIVVTVLAIIIANFGPGLLRAINEGDPNPEFEHLEDERDKLINLRGTSATYSVYSFGVLIAMLSYVLGQSALVMFTLLIFFGLIAQIIGDVTRLILYRVGV